MRLRSTMLAKYLKTLGAVVLASVVSVNAWALGGGSGGGSGPTKMIIGDSIFALSGDIHRNLEQDLNETIRTYARSGCQMNGGSLICSRRYAVPNQYENADKRGIRTVIMNGGGNDFLLGEGSRCTTEQCVRDVLMAIEQTIAGMVSDMRSDGIEEILFLGYYNLGDPERDAINAISMPYKAANYPAMGVTFVETRPAFQGNERRYISSDGIHPTAAGSRVLADLILDALD